MWELFRKKCVPVNDMPGFVQLSGLAGRSKKVCEK